MMDRQALRSLLIKHEKLRLKVYDDATGLEIGPGSVVKGHPTIGVGRALDVDGINEGEALLLLERNIEDCERQLYQAFPWFGKQTPDRQAVIICMVFNLGMDGFKEFKNLIAAISNQDFNSAANEMLSSHWAGQVGRRAVELADLMRGSAPIGSVPKLYSVK